MVVGGGGIASSWGSWGWGVRHGAFGIFYFLQKREIMMLRWRACWTDINTPARPGLWGARTVSLQQFAISRLG